MSEFPSDWEVTNLGTYLKETKERVHDGNATPYSVSKMLGIVPQSEKFKKRVASNDISNYKIIRKGDFAYDPMLLWDGSINRMLREDIGAVSPAYVTFRVISDSLDANYLLHFLKADQAKNFYKSISKGTNVRRQKAEFRDFAFGEFAFPPLPEQKKIAEILSGMDKLIASAEQQEAKNRNLALSIAENILTSNYEHRRLGDVTTLITKGTTPTSLGMSFSEQGINFIKVESIISDGVIDPVKFSFIETDVHGALKRSQIKSKDILFTIAGATVGKLALIDEHLLPANTNQALAIIRVKSKILRPRFAYHWLKGGAVKNIVAQLQTVGAQPNVSLSQISDFPMPIIPLDLQDYICHKLDSLDRVIDSIHKKIFTMQYLRQSLASDLLSGRKRVRI